jgi:hypothetical protein
LTDRSSDTSLTLRELSAASGRWHKKFRTVRWYRRTAEQYLVTPTALGDSPMRIFFFTGYKNGTSLRADRSKVVYEPAGRRLTLSSWVTAQSHRPQHMRILQIGHPSTSLHTPNSSNSSINNAPRCFIYPHHNDFWSVLMIFSSIHFVFRLKHLRPLDLDQYSP